MLCLSSPKIYVACSHRLFNTCMWWDLSGTKAIPGHWAHSPETRVLGSPGSTGRHCHEWRRSVFREVYSHFQEQRVDVAGPGAFITVDYPGASVTAR